MTLSFSSPPTLESVQDAFLADAGIRLDVVRLDCLHPQINGNKIFKLSLNLAAARESGHHTLLSFGGAYSNHLRALAAAARLEGMRSIGMVRGELVEPLNPVLRFARESGMQLYPVSRGDYRLKDQQSFIDSLQRRFGDFYLIPEGGGNELGVRGCEALAGVLRPWLPTLKEEARPLPPLIALACGTGTTLAGLVRGLNLLELNADVIGVAVLKGAGFLEHAVRNWLPDQREASRWRIVLDYHFGGYARQTIRLTEFIEHFQRRSGIPLEPVYTGKLLFALYDLIARGEIEPGRRVLCLHTGGVY